MLLISQIFNNIVNYIVSIVILFSNILSRLFSYNVRILQITLSNRLWLQRFHFGIIYALTDISFERVIYRFANFAKTRLSDSLSRLNHSYSSFSDFFLWLTGSQVCSLNCWRIFSVLKLDNYFSWHTNWMHLSGHIFYNLNIF